MVTSGAGCQYMGGGNSEGSDPEIEIKIEASHVAARLLFHLVDFKLGEQHTSLLPEMAAAAADGLPNRPGFRRIGYAYVRRQFRPPAQKSVRAGAQEFDVFAATLGCFAHPAEGFKDERPRVTDSALHPTKQSTERRPQTSNGASRPAPIDRGPPDLSARASRQDASKCNAQAASGGYGQRRPAW